MLKKNIINFKDNNIKKDSALKKGRLGENFQGKVKNILDKNYTIQKSDRDLFIQAYFAGVPNY